MDMELLHKLGVGEKLIQRRHDEMIKAHGLARAAQAYELATAAGASLGECPEWTDLLRAAFALFECNQLHDMLQEAKRPDEDAFGHDPRSLQSRIASAKFDEGLGK
jgi:hypothetical protein